MPALLVLAAILPPASTSRVVAEEPALPPLEGWAGTVTFDLTQTGTTGFHGAHTERYTVTLPAAKFIESSATPLGDNESFQTWSQGYTVDFDMPRYSWSADITPIEGGSICFAGGWHEASGSGTIDVPSFGAYNTVEITSWPAGALLEMTFDLSVSGTETIHGNDDCPDISGEPPTPSHTIIDQDWHRVVNLTVGLGNNLFPPGVDPVIGSPIVWPPPPPPPGEPIRLVGSKSITTYSPAPGDDPQGPGAVYYTTDITWDLALVLGTDQDGDGVPDADDACPAVPGVAANSGCPAEEDCDNATNHGFTATHYDADVQLTALPDPDVFDWEVTASWCVKDGVVNFKTVDSQGLVTTSWFAAGTVEAFFGVTAQYDFDDDASFVLPQGGTTTGVVDAAADFDVCVNPFTLFTAGGGRAMSYIGNKAAKAILGKMPKTGTAAAWLDQMTIRASDAAIYIDDQLVSAQQKALRDKELGARLEMISPDLHTQLSDSVSSEMAAVDLHLRGQTDNSLSSMADHGTAAYWSQFTDDHGRITINRTNQHAARAMWDSIVTKLATQIASTLTQLINYDVCRTVWHPILKIYVPHSGASFVDDTLVDGSILNVTGGISRDER